MRCLVLLPFAALSSVLVAQVTVSEALQNGKTTLDFRTRYENDDDAAFAAPADHKTANALTNQTRLGYSTGPFHDIKAKLEFLNVSAFGEERFNSTLNGRAQYAVVQDPGLTQVNQAYLEFKGLKVGRQVLSVDNQRFIGPGAWSQTPKGFTGAVFQNSTWIPATDLMVGHLIRIHTSLGVNRDIKADFARFRYTPWKVLNVAPFWFGVQETTAPKTSYQHQGLRIDGKADSFLYEASYAQQRGYKASTTTPDRQYRMGMVGFSRWGVTFKAVDEELEGGFDTPLSSLHGFYGWSDRIGKTPVKGLVDRYLLAETKQWGITFEGQLHRFMAQQDGQDYGKEWDLQAYRSFGKNLTLTLKWASYRGDSAAPSTNSLNKDLKKFWMMTTLKF